MGQLVGAIRGIGAACAALDMPIVSGNVSLYNETDGQGDPAHAHHRRRGPDRIGRPLIGAAPARGDLAVHRRDRAAIWASRAPLAEAFAAPRATPRRSTSRRIAQRRLHPRQPRLHRAATDLSDGGLALAAFEMAEAAGVGVTLDAADTPRSSARIRRATCRLSVRQGRGADDQGRAGRRSVAMVGRFGGDEVRIGDSVARLEVLREIHGSVFSSWMG
jgi:phosphoribosylformylglycinamidine synthase subunit PurL